ncbi:hypothetical protein IAT40_005662 [Kwoniella sp. CBS 6097]
MAPTTRSQSQSQYKSIPTDADRHHDGRSRKNKVSSARGNDISHGRSNNISEPTATGAATAISTAKGVRKKRDQAHLEKPSKSLAASKAKPTPNPNPRSKTKSFKPETNARPNSNGRHTPTTGVNQDRLAILKTLHTLLSHLRSADSTICPSQIPRALHADNPADYPNWREMMDPVRDIVWDEVRLGRCIVTQGGEERGYEENMVDDKPGAGIKGPIRVKKGVEWSARLVREYGEEG